MSFLSYLTLAVSILWWGSEIAIAIIRHSKPWSIKQDRLSYWVVWFAFLVSILAALGVSKSNNVGRFLLFEPFIGYTGCLIIAAGVGIRWIAVATLGRQFTLQVAIIKDHRLVDYGIYGVVRHPSYLGSLASFIGLGLVVEN